MTQLQPPLNALESILKTYLTRPSEESIPLQIFLRFSVESLPAEVAAALREMIQSYHSVFVSLLTTLGAPQPEEKAYTLLYWGIGIGALQLAGVEYSSNHEHLIHQKLMALDLIGV